MWQRLFPSSNTAFYHVRLFVFPWIPLPPSTKTSLYWFEQRMRRKGKGTKKILGTRNDIQQTHRIMFCILVALDWIFTFNVGLRFWSSILASSTLSSYSFFSSIGRNGRRIAHLQCLSNFHFGDSVCSLLFIGMQQYWFYIVLIMCINIRLSCYSFVSIRLNHSRMHDCSLPEREKNRGKECIYFLVVVVVVLFYIFCPLFVFCWGFVMMVVGFWCGVSTDSSDFKSLSSLKAIWVRFWWCFISFG